jgi:transcriptional regulator of arginine metabolism
MKYGRQAKILELVENNCITTQEELTEFLRSAGYKITQATVSRDIKELRLVKIMNENGKYKYSTNKKNEQFLSEKLLNIFKESYSSSDYANNLVVVKTMPGMAQAAAFVVDSIEYFNIIGSIAGDDTVIIVCRANDDAKELVGRFDKLVNQVK